MNIRPETEKLLEGNIGDKLLDISFRDEFLKFDTKTKGNKTKNNQVGLYSNQTKKLLHSKGKHQQNRKIITESKKIFVNHICDRGIIYKIYNKLM